MKMGGIAKLSTSRLTEAGQARGSLKEADMLFCPILLVTLSAWSKIRAWSQRLSDAWPVSETLWMALNR